MDWRLTVPLLLIEVMKRVLIAAHHYIRIFSSSINFMDWQLTVSLSLIEVTKLVLISGRMTFIAVYHRERGYSNR